MQLTQYLQRVDYGGAVEPSRDVLGGLLRCHVLGVPFENLDVQRGYPLTTDVDAALDKIVTRKRGGWCYEQNGVFGWALEQIGFDVTRVSAAVMRKERGEVADDNHLTLLVRIPGQPKKTYLADAGFGGSMINPIELAEGSHDQEPFTIGLRKLDGEGWRFFEDAGDGEFSFDFAAKDADENALSKRCEFLQTDPSSGFVQTLVAQIRTVDSHKSLRGRVLNTVGSNGFSKHVIDSEAEFVDTLANEFMLDTPGAAELWPKVVARHEEFMREADEQ